MPEDTPQDPADLIAQIRATADQARAGMSEFAASLIAFRTALCAGGFSAPIAEQMTATYMATLLAAGIRHA
jgi:hypothetical protein